METNLNIYYYKAGSTRPNCAIESYAIHADFMAVVTTLLALLNSIMSKILLPDFSTSVCVMHLSSK